MKRFEPDYHPVAIPLDAGAAACVEGKGRRQATDSMLLKTGELP
jgi:hypothetical protein